MLLGDPFHFLARWPPFKWLHSLPSFSPVANLMRGRWLRRFIGTDGTALFYRCLPYKAFTVYPNRQTASSSNQRDPVSFNSESAQMNPAIKSGRFHGRLTFPVNICSPTTNIFIRESGYSQQEIFVRSSDAKKNPSHPPHCSINNHLNAYFFTDC